MKFRGRAYEVGKQLFEQFKAAVRQQQQQPTAPQSLKQFGHRPDRLARRPQGRGRRGHRRRRHPRSPGDVDVEKVVTTCSRRAAQSALSASSSRPRARRCRRSPRSPTRTSRRSWTRSTKPRFEVNVDENDVRAAVFVEADFDVPEGIDADGAQGRQGCRSSYVLEKVGDRPGDRGARRTPSRSALCSSQFGLGRCRAAGSQRALAGFGFRSSRSSDSELMQ